MTLIGIGPASVAFHADRWSVFAIDDWIGLARFGESSTLGLRARSSQSKARGTMTWPFSVLLATLTLLLVCAAGAFFVFVACKVRPYSQASFAIAKLFERLRFLIALGGDGDA